MRLRLVHIAWCLLAALIAIPAQGAGDEMTVGSPPRVALLPLANLTDHPEATRLVTDKLEAHLAQMPVVLIPAAELRSVLRRHRIRTVGSAERHGLELIATELTVDFALVGSVTSFAADTLPELGLSLRLLTTRDCRIHWANSASATGMEYESLLGIGRITDVGMLADLVVPKSLGGLDRALRADKSPATGEETIGLVPFDDLESGGKAGELMTDLMLTQLISEGIGVIEPGEIARLGRMLGQSSRGSISGELMVMLRDSLKVTLLLTGTVDYLRGTTPGLVSDNAAVGVGGRLVEAASGRVIEATDIEKSAGSRWLGQSHGSLEASLLNPVAKQLIHDLHIKKRTLGVIP